MMMKGKSKNQAAPEISFSDPATMPIVRPSDSVGKKGTAARRN